MSSINEVTTTTTAGDYRVVGVVSTNPAYLMNSKLEGTVVAVALRGRVPCKVIGKINKGDVLVSSAQEGHAQKSTQPYFESTSVIGRALESKDTDGEGIIEIVV